MELTDWLLEECYHYQHGVEPRSKQAYNTLKAVGFFEFPLDEQDHALKVAGEQQSLIDGRLYY